MLEGYLGGVALDVLLMREVTPDEEVKLQERDDTKGRAVRLSLRDKILQYSKIACNQLYPPIQESSSRSMGRVLEFEQKIRHALIHPTPAIQPGQPWGSREVVYLQLTLEEAADICDSTIMLISEISDKIGPQFGDVTEWLAYRDPNGLFPETTFR